MITNLIVIFSSIQLVILWLYFAIFTEKRVISLSHEDIKEYLIYFQYSLGLRIILCIFIGYSLFKLFAKPSHPKSRFQFIQKTLEVIQNYIYKYNVFYKSYDIIFKFFGTGSRYVLFIIAASKHILGYSPRKNMVIIYSCMVLPKAAIIFIFFLEILSGELHYYFYSLILLIISLLFKLVLFMFKDVHERVFPEAQSMVIAEAVAIENTPGKNMLRMEYRLKPEYDDIDPNIFFPKYYLPLLYLETHLWNIEELYIRINMSTLFIYHLCHIIGFIYILSFLI